MKNLIKKLTRWYFRKKIQVYANEFAITDFELEIGKEEVLTHLKRRAAMKLGEKLLEDGYIEFWEVPNTIGFHRRFRGKLHVIK